MNDLDPVLNTILCTIEEYGKATGCSFAQALVNFHVVSLQMLVKYDPNTSMQLTQCLSAFIMQQIPPEDFQKLLNAYGESLTETHAYAVGIKRVS